GLRQLRFFQISFVRNAHDHGVVLLFLCGGQKKLLSQIVCWDRSETFSCGATRLSGNPPSHAHYHAPALVDGEPPPGSPTTISARPHRPIHRPPYRHAS